jgi:cysteine desulfurase
LPIEALLLRALRERVLEGVRAALPQAYLFGHPETRLPGHLSLGFAGEESRVGKLLEELDNAGISVSAGSACSAHHAGNPSQALLAMGYNEESARGLLRVTLGRFNTREEVDRFLQVLPGAVEAGNAEDLLQAAGSLQE